MSDAPDQRRGGTAPLPMTAEPSAAPVSRTAPMHAAAPRAAPAPRAPRAATQMSPTAAAPAGMATTLDDGATDTDKSPPAFVSDEIDGAVLAREVVAASAAPAPALAPVPAPAAAPRPHEPSRRGGPATLMSPAVAQPGALPPSPPLAPENAVVDVGAPAHAFMQAGHGGSAPYGAGAMTHHAPPNGAGGDTARPQRRTSTTFLLMIAAGVVAGVVVLVAIVGGLFYVTERQKTEKERAQHAAAAAPATTAEAPRGPTRFGGPKARLGVTTTGTLDPEAIRAALAVALPRIDACFAAAELEPPNHESAAYDLDVQATGEVKHAEAATTVNRAPKLDACVLASVRTAHLPKATRASTVRLTFSAPLDVR